MATAPLPHDGSRTVPLTGAQMVVPRSASEAERRGAFAFWRYLMEVDNIERWVRASFFLPVRRSAAERLVSGGLVELSASGDGERIRLTRRGRFLGGGVTAELARPSAFL